MEYLLKASVVTGIFYLCYKVFLQRETFFEKTRWFLLIGLLSSFLFPFLVIPNYVETAPLQIQGVDLNYTSQVENSGQESFSYFNYVLGAYGIGVLFFLSRFIFQVSTLSRLIWNHKKEHQGSFTMVKTTKKIAPFSFFNWIVYNPEQFDSSELEQIMTHEKVHVRENHSFDILLGQLSSIILWFNPFIWFYNKALKQNLEFIADKKAFQKSPCKKSYQYTLLKTSFPSYQFALSSPFYNSLIKKRIIMLQQSKSKKINQLKFALVIPVLTFFLMSFNTKTIYVEKAQPKMTKTIPVKPLSEPQEQSVKNEKPQPVASEFPATKPIKNQNPSTYVIQKNTSDSELDDMAKKAQDKGVKLTFKGVKRNSSGEIIAIKIDAKSDHANANYNYNSDTPIDLIKVAFGKDGKNISIGNSTAMAYTIKEKEKKTTYVISNTKAQDVHENEDEDQKIVLRKVKTTKANDKAVTVTGYGNKKNSDDNVREIIIISENDAPEDVVVRRMKNDTTKSWTVVNTKDPEPMYVLDGKVIERETLNDILPNDIEKINVLKGESAIKKYGEKGKDGVIEITTK
ncbi:M56 family metallopeptidase [Gaetbulibacter sp. M240]|uniref:M56 family metallopeptidase n=1 Tax=Gaetbulibacter sp. M240 TaxID=3126511 RepID=UPI00374EC503